MKEYDERSGYTDIVCDYCGGFAAYHNVDKGKDYCEDDAVDELVAEIFFEESYPSIMDFLSSEESTPAYKVIYKFFEDEIEEEPEIKHDIDMMPDNYLFDYLKDLVLARSKVNDLIAASSNDWEMISE